MLILIRGAGDIASGIAIRLYRSGFDVIMTDTARPTAIRRTVSFSGAIVAGGQTVEDVTARLANTPEDALNITKQGDIAVLADEKCDCLRTLSPNALVDAILVAHRASQAQDPDTLVFIELSIDADAPQRRIFFIPVVVVAVDIEDGAVGECGNEREIFRLEIPAGEDEVDAVQLVPGEVVPEIGRLVVG